MEGKIQEEKRKKQGVRLLILREMLDKGKNINKDEIKTKFDIDDKTFQRDIDFLRAFYTENVDPEIEIRYDKQKEGYILDITDIRYHHEIYLSDVRKVSEDKLKTVIRHPIKKRKGI